MSLAAGALSKTSVGPTTASLVSAAATGGTGPYTYQWYRSTVSGFTPGGGNLIAGATALTLNDTGLIPNTQYYYEVVVTDTGNGNATANSAQLAVQTSAPVLSPNQFAQSSIVGMIDMRFPYNTVAAQVDSSQATPLYAGQAVKIVDSVDGIPKIVGCSANSDEVFGFINYDVKSITFSAGQNCEISMAGSFIYLYATTAISRGTQVQLDISTVGGVAAKVGSSGADIVGYAFDKAAAPGALIRVHLTVPSFLKA
jgi:predicted RecA/RadA family phage recombinase